MIRVLSMLFCVVLATGASGQDDLGTIRKRLVAEVLKAGADDESAGNALETMWDDGSWPEIDYEDLSLTGFEHQIHIENLRLMALAYCDKGSVFYREPGMKTAINRGLRYWCDHDFKSDNWWHNIIFVPKELVAISLIMGDDIEPEIRKEMQPVIRRASKDSRWARPSGDRAKICGIQAKNLVLVADEAGFTEIVKVLEGEIKLSTGKRGVQCDFSHHHRVHRVNTTTKYGLSYVGSCIEWAGYVAGTRYAFSDERIRLLVDFYLDGICKQMVYGVLSDKGVCNRDITRREDEPVASPELPEKLLGITDYRRDELREIIGLRKGEIGKPTLSFCKFFWQTEHLAFQRPDFYTSVRMFSTRNRNMELAHNSEGIFNHHRADGTNHLAVMGDEYLNIWPAYDWQKIPGTTVLQKPKMPSQHEVLQDGLTDFVGAATDGMYGVAGFDFISPHDLIRVKKSWFFFDDEYVCLGAGIASNDFRNPVVTTINQALLRGDVMVSKAGEETKFENGDHEIDRVDWVLHNGTGYRFPKPTKVHVMAATRSGRWSDINKQASSPRELVEQDVFGLWIDHGLRPQGENLWLAPGKMDTKDVTYEYIVVPVASRARLNERATVEILVNSSRVQAVRHAGLGLVQVVFYQAGKVDLGGGRFVTLDSPGIVMLETKEDRVVKVTASDPTRKLGRLHLGVSGMSVVMDLPQGGMAGASVIREM